MKAQPVRGVLADRFRGGAVIGLLALEADATIEDEWRALLPAERAGFYTGRVACDTEITPETLLRVERPLRASVRSLLPGTELDVIAFACTSASLFLGEARVSALVKEARPGVEVTTPLTAAKAALERVQATRLGVLTPYVDEINGPLVENLSAHGFEVVSLASFFVGNDIDVVRITDTAIADGARQVAAASVDAVFIACTALRASGLVPALELEFGVPVTTSNHALAWHSLELAGVRGVLPGRGQLFDMSRGG